MSQDTIEQPRYKNILLQQNVCFLQNLEIIIQRIKPKRIVEIGTARGGVTFAMGDILIAYNLSDVKIKTFDIRMKDHIKPLIDHYSKYIEFYVGNIFNYRENSLTLPDAITDFVSQTEVNLFLCDGGNKISEFNTIAPLLKSGDVIMAHDYAPNQEIRDNDYVNKIWNHWEISDEDIEKSVQDYGLVDYDVDFFKPTAWVCKIKE